MGGAVQRNVKYPGKDGTITLKGWGLVLPPRDPVAAGARRVLKLQEETDA